MPSLSGLILSRFTTIYVISGRKCEWVFVPFSSVQSFRDPGVALPSFSTLESSTVYSAFGREERKLAEDSEKYLIPLARSHMDQPNCRRVWECNLAVCLGGKLT